VAQLFSLGSNTHIKPQTKEKKMKQIPTIALTISIALLTGCVSSPQERAPQEAPIRAQQAQQENIRKEAADHIKQNLASLHAGLTINEVDEILGPIPDMDKSVIQTGRSMPITINGPMTFTKTGIQWISSTQPGSDATGPIYVLDVQSVGQDFQPLTGEAYRLTFTNGRLLTWSTIASHRW
jgi:hypothetical protein